MRVTAIRTSAINPNSLISFKDDPRRNRTQQGQEDMPQNAGNLNFASAVQTVEPMWKQATKIAQRYLDGWQIAALNGLR